MELTAKLTAERDKFLYQYHTLRKEYLLFTSQNNNSNSNQNYESEDYYAAPPTVAAALKEKNIQRKQGFSFLSLVIIATATYILTRYIQAKFATQDQDN